jgi:hypothetical protein
VRPLFILPLLATVGCGSATSSTSDAGGGSEGGVEASCAYPAPCDLVEPPAPPAGDLIPGGRPHNYALMQLFMGDTDRNGSPSPTAWQSFGYDLDGKVTTTSSTDVCTLLAGAARQVQLDGNGGIDNSWGANLMPLLLTIDAEASTQVNGAIEDGDWTSMTYVVGFDDSAGNHTSALGLTGVQLTGARYPGGPPPWNPTTSWPVDPASVQGCSYPAGCAPGTNPLTSALFKFNGFQNKGVFSIGAPGASQPFTLPLALGGVRLSLNIQSALITFHPKVPGAVTDGTIAGVILASDLAAQLAEQLSPTPPLCTSTAYQTMVQQIEQMADIVLNAGSVSNSTGVTCNAISIGLGFNADEIAIPTDIALPTPPQPDSCPDGG